MMRRWSVLFLSALASCVSSNFLDQPTLRWSFDLPRNTLLATPRSVLRGNSVVVSQDGSRVFVTARDGSLHVVRTDDVSRSTVFEPSVRGTTSGESGVALAQSEEAGVLYAVYAVMDEQEGVVSSRIFVVDKDGNRLYTVEVPGQVLGTPIVTGGARIYVVHNIVDENDDTVGRVSVIEVTEDAAELVATISGGDGFVRAPFAGGTGRAVQQGADVRDRVVISLAGEQRGSVFVLVPSAQFDELQGRGEEAYELLLVSNFAFPTTISPTLSRDGDSVYLAHGSRVSAWSGDRGLDQVIDGNEENMFPLWEEQLGTDFSFGTIFTAPPVLSVDESFLYLVSETDGLVCMDAARGQTEWTELIDTATTSRPVVASTADNRNTMVHLIEALTGRVQQYSGANGNLLWETSCSIISGTDQCDSSVEADFSITSTRNTLYYALTNGTVVALAIAEFTTEAPTPIPTDPTTALPTGSVSETGGPTETPASSGFTWPPTTEKPALPYDPETLLGGSSQDQPGSSSALDSNLVIILASIAGLFALLVLIVCCYICKQKKRKDSILRLQAVKEEEANRHMKEEALVAKEMKDLEEETMNALAKDPADSKKSKGKRGSNKAATPAPPATLDAIAETPEDDGAVSEGEEGGDDNMSETGIGVEVSIADESEFRPPEAAPEKVNRTLSYSLGKVSKEVAAVVPAVRKKLLESKENSENAHDESILKVNIDDSSTVCSKSSLKKMTDNSSIGEPGRLPLTVKDYLKERDCVSPLPVPSGTSVGVTSPASPMGPNFSPVGPETPNSPSWDVMSFDESLYMDDETLTTARSAAQRATSPVPLQPTTPTPQVPDDEPGAIRPGRPSPDPAEVSQQPAVYRPQPRPISYQPIRRPAAEIMSDNLVTKSHTNVPATYVKGASVRPRAGLFTRAENPNTSHSSAEYSSEGYVQEREGRAVYAMKGSPTLPTASTTSSARPASQQRGSGASKEKKSSKSSSPASYAYSAWDSFLSELAKVEDQFFNPTAARRQSPPPPPPPPKSRTRQPRKKQVRVLQAKYDSSSDSDNYDTESLD